MVHKQVNHLLAILHSARVNFLAEHEFGIGIVQPVVKFEFRVLPRLLDRPASEAARHFRDVFLRVTAIHAEGVQFHQLAPVILIQPAFIFFGLLRVGRRTRHAQSSAAPLLARGSLGRLPLRGPRISAQKIVQIEKHRGAFCR